MRALILCIAAFLAYLPAQAGEPALEISSAWIPEAPPTARMLAGYLDVANRGEKPLVIAGAASEAFGKVEIHRTIQVDGVARMRRQTHIEVAPGKAVHFEPGGLHLMLMRPENPPRAGDEIQLRLIDEDGSEYPFTAQVRKRGE